MKKINYYIYLLITLTIVACDPSIDDKTELGSLPNPSFEIMEGANANTFILTNTTPDVFLVNWLVEGVGSFEGDEVEVAIDFMGDYPVTMTVFNQGGSAMLTKSINVEQHNAGACEGNFELLTDCDTKTWVLAPEAGAMNVGPSLNETWWANSEDDVAARECHFNDEYIFSVDGTFEYKNNGDFWADTDGDGNIWPSDLGLPVGCNASTDWPEAYSAWDSGIHSFSVNDVQLTVSGLGAWIGLYKVGTAAEVAQPQPSVSYSISELNEERMVIFADLGGVVWRFTLVAQ